MRPRLKGIFVLHSEARLVFAETAYATMFFMRFFAVLVLTAALLGSVSAGDGNDDAFRTGLSAFNSGKYASALAAWRPLAERGDPRAQESVGYLYYSGRGVPRDTRQAAAYFYRAADQGEPTAQLFLAYMHFNSIGVPQNSPLAMMWAELAMDGGLFEAYDLRGSVMESMTDAERAEGWRLLDQWRAIHARTARTR